LRPGLPRTVSGWTTATCLGLVAGGLAGWVVRALLGHGVPDQSVDLAFPMGPGTYLVANGGSNRTVNGHFLTLEPTTDRQRAHRAQSFAVDLVKLGDFGLRAPGWRPSDPADYVIFREPVTAPCSGRVLATHDGMPDMSVPNMDTSRLEGNHVFMDCGGVGVLLAHLRQGSVRVSVGEHLATGQQLGEVGNSGQSAEPHLHIHAQHIPTEGPLLAGAPLFITLNGTFPVRNARMKVPQGQL
jgi:hypothetical protein